MLINLSNHPFKDWEIGHQKAAMVLFGRVEDIPFPDVNPKDRAWRAYRNKTSNYLKMCIGEEKSKKWFTINNISL